MSDKKKTIAVIAAVYDGDDAGIFKKAMDSIFLQTYHDYDVYLYVDAVKNEDLIKAISIYQAKTNFFTFYGEERKGLAFGLNYLLDKIKKINYGYIARMDSDDISREERFKSQVEFLENNRDVSVVGTNCIEIDGDGNELFHKMMPENHNDIISTVVKRSPFIHPTVMFRGDLIAVLEYNNNLMNTQDYYLWIDLLSKGYKFHNIQYPHLYFRVNEGFYNRRGLSKVLNEVKSRLYAIHKLDQRYFKSYAYVVGLIMLRLAPVSIKKYCYKRFR